MFDYIDYDEQCEFNSTAMNNPRVVLVRPQLLSSYLTLANNCSFLSPLIEGEKRALVMIGSDIGIKSFQERLERLMKYNLFSSYWFEAKNINMQGVNTFPRVFHSNYLKNSGFHNIFQAVQKSDEEPKSKFVLAAWGAVYKGT
jgi:hypothetical protein